MFTNVYIICISWNQLINKVFPSQIKQVLSGDAVQTEGPGHGGLAKSRSQGGPATLNVFELFIRGVIYGGQGGHLPPPNIFSDKGVRAQKEA